MDRILQIEQVDYTYPDGTRALDALSLGFARGRRTAVLGRNGAGKSSLFALLNGLEKPSRGLVHFDGVPIAYDRRGLAQLRRRVGLVFQEPDTQLFAASLREDVSFGPLNLGLGDREVRQRVDASLQAVGLAELADRPTQALSYGEKKRACIAGVLAMDPEVLILDEPSAGLDSASAAGVMALLDSLHARGITLILATHDMDLAFSWADDICVLHQGTLAVQAQACDLEALEGVLDRLGLELPWVYEVYAGLRRRGLLPSQPLPRNRRELLERIESAHADASLLCLKGTGT